MQHSELYENQAKLSDSDFNKLQKIGKWFLVIMVTSSASIITIAITI